MASNRQKNLPIQRWLTDHSLSLSFVSLFLVCLVGQSISGHISYNSELSMHGFPAIGYVRYLGTGNFLDGILTNWQAAILQLACLIVFSAKFRERGAAHSLAPAMSARKSQNQESNRRPWLYRHSLATAFSALFLLTFAAHLLFGAMQYNSTLRMIHKPPVSTLDYGLGSAFWFSSTQTWEAEFAAIAIYVIASVFLRQQGSPESKPVESRNEETGKTNH